MTTYTPRELAAELGCTNESRSGTGRADLLTREIHGAPKHERWRLDEVQANDVRANVPRASW
jgi:hypothetical protein